MTKPTESEVQPSQMYRPEEVQEMFGIKKVAYYNRLKFLEMQAHKDEEGKVYLDENQLDMLKELDYYINMNGKMTGFSYSKNDTSLVMTDDNSLTTSPNSSTASNNSKAMALHGSTQLCNHSATNEPDIYVTPEEPTAQFNMEQLLYEAAQLKARELAMQDLVKRALADGMNESDLPQELRNKVNLAREAANPKFTPQDVATTLLSQWRQNRLAS